MDTVLTFLDRDLPQVSTERIQAFVCDRYGIEGTYQKLSSERDLCFRIKTQMGGDFTLKISNAAEPEGIVNMQVKALAHIAASDPDLPAPRMIPTRDGRLYDRIDGDDGASHMVRMLSFLPGIVLENVLDHCPDRSRTRRELGAFTARLGQVLGNFFHPSARDNLHPWDLGRVTALRNATLHIRDTDLRAACEGILNRAETHTYPALARTRHQIIHQDAHMGNVLVSSPEARQICGVIDFGDMLYGSLLADLVTAADCFTEDETDPIGVLCDICAGYDEANPLEEHEIDLVFDMALLRLVNTVLVLEAREALVPGGDDHIGNTGKHARMLQLMQAEGHATATARLRRACRFPVAVQSEPDTEYDRLFEKREAALGRIWHFYDKPLHFVSGRGAWLTSADGTDYLDAYNNVPQVGHSNPHVVRTIGRQAAALNTNTRYLCDIVGEYADRLLSTLPDRFDACIFVNSGSEANDAATQIARHATGHTGGLVMQGAYHGVTQSTMELSPITTGGLYDHIACLQVPDMYRGPFAGDPQAATKYAADCDRAIADLKARGHAPAVFMVDTALCSSGLAEAPAGYYNLLADKVHAAGGLVIADEVQAGLGRLGQLWGCTAQGLNLENVDFLTLGKPVGNGHPLGVVLTRKELWEPFNDHTELFSTFGGNTVSCAAGMAVLDEIENRDLIAQGNDVGDYFRAELWRLAKTHDLIGDVRGKGMLIGLEFVTCRTRKTPARAETSRLVNMMKDRQVLIGSAGPDKNVLKLRPSLIWGKNEVDFFIEALSSCLTQIAPDPK